MSWVQVPSEADFSLKNNCFGQVVLCCFVFLLCCVALPCLSKHLMDDYSHVQCTCICMCTLSAGSVAQLVIVSVQNVDCCGFKSHQPAAHIQNMTVLGELHCVVLTEIRVSISCTNTHCNVYMLCNTCKRTCVDLPYTVVLDCVSLSH